MNLSSAMSPLYGPDARDQGSALRAHGDEHMRPDEDNKPDPQGSSWVLRPVSLWPGAVEAMAGPEARRSAMQHCRCRASNSALRSCSAGDYWIIRRSLPPPWSGRMTTRERERAE